MRYESGSAFRMALEARLRTESLDTNVPLARLRKTVAFDRLLARMMNADQGDRWLLKGGLALQVRMPEGARTTKDIDVLLREFGVDVGVGDPVVATAESFEVTHLLEFAGIPPTTVRCYPMSQHLAEKIHALTRPHGNRENSRVKDLVDIVIIAERSALAVPQAREAFAATFAARQTHAVPTRLPAFPRAWSPAYRRMAGEVGVKAHTFEEGLKLAGRFINPLLDGSAAGTWLPEHRRYSRT